MKEPVNLKSKPDLESWLFWDWKVEDIDWEKASRSVVERVLVWGNDQDYEELIRFYSRDRIIQALTKEHVMLPNYEIDHVCGYFGLKKEELYCYRKRLERKYRWI